MVRPSTPHLEMRRIHGNRERSSMGMTSFFKRRSRNLDRMSESSRSDGGKRPRSCSINPSASDKGIRIPTIQQSRNDHNESPRSGSMTANLRCERRAPAISKSRCLPLPSPPRPSRVLTKTGNTAKARNAVSRPPISISHFSSLQTFTPRRAEHRSRVASKSHRSARSCHPLLSPIQSVGSKRKQATPKGRGNATKYIPLYGPIARSHPRPWTKPQPGGRSC